MLPLNRLREYQAECCEMLRDCSNQKIFNYTNMVVDDKQLSKILKERIQEDNTYLISVIPSFNMKGQEDNTKWENMLQFFVLDKTDYSDQDHDGFLDIFVQTQAKAQAFVDKLLEDKANTCGLFCGFLSWLNESSIQVNPVWNLDGCNGWEIQINLDTTT